MSITKTAAQSRVKGKKRRLTLKPRKKTYCKEEKYYEDE